ncbi:MAG: hypothetical protein VKK59_02520 [Vampirovibrionales bacterium]|nr:hypothetical protein [Vampirovibrionales bacterium]
MSLKPPFQPDSLPDTLAQRVQVLRELRGFSSAKLAHLASIPLELLQDIEGGLMPFLPEVTRRRLARALRIPTEWLKQVERVPGLTPTAIIDETMPLPANISPMRLDDTVCPECSGVLHQRSFEREDPDGGKYTLVRSRCSQCLFQRSIELAR